jgi:hypothetical protein
MSNICPVCGYPELTDDPKRLGSFEICRSCGFQFGVSDRGITHDQWRKQWIESGMLWNSKGRKPPENWDPKTQLENLKNLK